MGFFTDWFKKQPEYKEEESGQSDWDCEMSGHVPITDNRSGATECLVCKNQL